MAIKGVFFLDVALLWILYDTFELFLDWLNSYLGSSNLSKLMSLLVLVSLLTFIKNLSASRFLE